VTGVALFDSDWFDRTLTEPQGYARAESVLLHELGHVVGLGHVTDRKQIMFAMETPSVTRYAAGDLAGLAKLGAGVCEPRL
jgi:predicted Zn-dependent protease